MNEITVQSELKLRSYNDSDVDKALQEQVLIVPELFPGGISPDENSQFVRNDVSDVYKIFSQAGYTTEIVLDKRLKRKALILKSADIVLPLILFAAGVPVAVATGYIANWLSSRFAGEKSLTIKYEHARFGKDGKIVDYVKLEGNAEEVAKVLKSGKFQSTDIKNRVLNSPRNGN